VLHEIEELFPRRGERPVRLVVEGHLLRHVEALDIDTDEPPVPDFRSHGHLGEDGETQPAITMCLIVATFDDSSAYSIESDIRRKYESIIVRISLPSSYPMNEWFSSSLD